MKGTLVETKNKDVDVTESISRRLGAEPSGKTTTANAYDPAVDGVSDPDKAYIYDKLVHMSILRDFTESNFNEKFEILSYSTNLVDGNYPRFVVIKSLRTGKCMKGYYYDETRNKNWAARVPGSKYDMLSEMVRKGADIETIERSTGVKQAKIESLIALLEAEEEHLFPVFLTESINKYDFLPDFVRRTNKYVFFEWFEDYEQATPEDFLTGMSHIKSKFKIPLKKITTSALFDDLVSRFHDLYKSEQIPFLDSEPLPRGDLAYFSTCESPTITVDNIAYDDIVVKRVDGEIVDWKFIDIGNFNVGFPRYVFNMDETYPDIVPVQEHINSVMCCHDGKWFKIISADDLG